MFIMKNSRHKKMKKTKILYSPHPEITSVGIFECILLAFFYGKLEIDFTTSFTCCFYSLSLFL